MENTKYFEIDEIDIDKIRVSDRSLYKKQRKSYKYYVFYEHNDKNIPLKIMLIDVVGYYNEYKNNSKYDTEYSAKKMNFKLDDNSIDKVYDIFEHIEEKLNIGLSSFVYESCNGDEYLKTIVFDKTLFVKDNNSK